MTMIYNPANSEIIPNNPARPKKRRYLAPGMAD